MGPGEYEIKLSSNALEDLRFWYKSGQSGLIKKIERLLGAIAENPVSGIGKPEMLKHGLAERYSRRINQEHRIIYSINDNSVNILSLRGHY